MVFRDYQSSFFLFYRMEHGGSAGVRTCVLPVQFIHSFSLQIFIGSGAGPHAGCAACAGRFMESYTTAYGFPRWQH